MSKQNGTVGTDVLRLMRLARSQLGWTVEQSPKTGHWHWRDSTGKLVTVTSNTPSDRNQIRQVRSCLRKHGVR